MPPSGTKVGTFMKGIDMPGGDYNITHFATPDPGNAQKCEAACRYALFTFRPPF